MSQSRSAHDPPPGGDQERIWDAPDGHGSPGDDDPTTSARAMSGADGGSPAPTPAGRDSPASRSPGRVGAASGPWSRSLTSTSPSPGPAGLLIADVPNRILAFILDVIVLAVLGMILALLVGGAFGGLATGASLDSAGGDLNIGAFLVVAVAQLGISFAYFGYSWVALRATPGMRMMGLQIGDGSDGHSISWNHALLRWLVLGAAATVATYPLYVPSMVGLVLGLVAVVWLAVLLYTMGQDPRRQGLHDRYAHTILVKASRRPG